MDYDWFCETCHAYLGTGEYDPQESGDIIECEECDPASGLEVLDAEG